MAGAKVFSIEGKGLKLTTAEDIEPHIQDLKSNDSVEEIKFLGNTLGIGASEALAKVLESKKNLQIANLADIFTSRLLSEIPPALSHLLTSLLTLPNLHTVDLSDNAFGLNTVAPLVDFLSQHTPLRYLYLNNNGLGPAAGVLVADALTALAAKKEAARKEGKDVPDLELVICGRNRLENGSMAAWAKAYAANKGVKTIKMTQNGIRQEGISHLITNGLAHLTQLDTLDLQDNTFTAMGANALSKAVGNWTELRELGVGDCLLSGRGGIALAAALEKGNNKKVEVLRLQFNDINAKGLAGLASASSTALPLLRRVEINGNKFDEEDPVSRNSAMCSMHEKKSQGSMLTMRSTGDSMSWMSLKTRARMKRRVMRKERGATKMTIRRAWKLRRRLPDRLQMITRPRRPTCHRIKTRRLMIWRI
ncbi:hypothetical protein CFE70_008409 [Pyrenophora teres f. teres 0-1]